MTEADLFGLLDAVVNPDAVVVLQDTAFTTPVHITGPCIIRDCYFPEGLTVGRGGSIRFEGKNWITKNGRVYLVEKGAYYATDHADP